jgi:peptidoglycan/LPS O-acetylase OafA/YrhL
LNAFLYGTLAMAAAVIALLFARVRRLNGDRLFAYFATAFAILSANWVLIALTTPSDETRYYLYLPRLLAFGVIIAGIVDKNRARRATRRPGGITRHPGG